MLITIETNIENYFSMNRVQSDGLFKNKILLKIISFVSPYHSHHNPCFVLFNNLKAKTYLKTENETQRDF